MKLLHQSIELLPQEQNLGEVYKKIELVGRTCYQSESHIGEKPAKDFVDRMIRAKHFSPVEHGTIYLTIPYGSEEVSWYDKNPFSRVTYSKVIDTGEKRAHITTNLRVIAESGRWLDLKRYSCACSEFHMRRVTVKCITNRQIANELVRHRAFSFMQESTRFCVAGDTKLKFQNPHWHYTIEDLYNKSLIGKNGSWKRLLIENLDENTGILGYNKIKNIFYNGEKRVYRLTTKLGYTIKCTTDHLIYTPNGYKRLKELSVGDYVYVNGQEVNTPLYKNKDWLYNQNITLNKTFVQIGKEFGYNVSTLKNWARKFHIPNKGTGYFNKNRIPWNKGISEDDDNRVKNQANALREFHHTNAAHSKIMKIDTSRYQKYMKKCCEVCGTTTDLEVHHIDKNHQNNNPNNLLTVCSSCHQKIHNQTLTTLFKDSIISIEDAGIEKVYDLEMEYYHNYVANGIIVHNCNYSKEKFGNHLTFIIPSNIQTDDDINQEILNAWKNAEMSYLKVTSEFHARPQDAAQILPLGLKTTIYMTGFLDDSGWKNFMSLRYFESTGPVHPLMKELSTLIYSKMKEEGWIS